MRSPPLIADIRAALIITQTQHPKVYFTNEMNDICVPIIPSITQLHKLRCSVGAEDHRSIGALEGIL